MESALTTRGKNRHNVGVVQMSGCLSLVFEALQLTGIESRREGQYFERDAATE
jgi:hypothetical protein